MPALLLRCLCFTLYTAGVIWNLCKPVFLHSEYLKASWIGISLNTFWAWPGLLQSGSVGTCLSLGILQTSHSFQKWWSPQCSLPCVCRAQLVPPVDSGSGGRVGDSGILPRFSNSSRLYFLSIFFSSASCLLPVVSASWFSYGWLLLFLLFAFQLPVQLFLLVSVLPATSGTGILSLILLLPIWTAVTLQLCPCPSFYALLFLFHFPEISNQKTTNRNHSLTGSSHHTWDSLKIAVPVLKV